MPAVHGFWALVNRTNCPCKAFTSLFKFLFTDSKEINADDIDFKNITSSLTRKQAEAVKRRVNKLNAKVKERLSLQETSEGPQRLFVPENLTNSKQRADVRSLFPMQTVGEASNKERPSTFKSRHSYSEGVTLSTSEVRTMDAFSRRFLFSANFTRVFKISRVAKRK